MNEDRVLKLVYDLLDQYDRSIWEDIQYIDLANAWINILNHSYETLAKEVGSKDDVSISDLEDLRKNMLLDYLKGDKCPHCGESLEGDK